jgi:hypothetical protein
MVFLVANNRKVGREYYSSVAANRATFPHKGRPPISAVPSMDGMLAEYSQQL